MAANLIGLVYRKILRPILFLFDPESVHDRALSLGVFLGSFRLTRLLTRSIFRYQDASLRQNILGLTFDNPIGLAAGFDKNSRLMPILPEVGFGFEEIGSITGEPCLGNPKPRLWRLPKSKSLLVYYGLMNDGADAISSRLKGKKFSFPVGVSIAKTNSPQTTDLEAGVGDYFKAYKTFRDLEVGDYFTINISCPNAFGGEPFTDPDRLDRLLKEIFSISKKRPIFIKFSPDLSLEQVDKILEVANRYEIDGFVATNLTKPRDNPAIKDENIPKTGGLSGKAVDELSDKMIAHLYKKTEGKKVIIGCGGIFSAEDAYRKIRLGASLVQLITGMIYEGPQLIGEINKDLVKLLQKDGFKNIKEAVGADFL